MFFHVNTRNGCVVLTCSSVKHSFNFIVKYNVSITYISMSFSATTVRNTIEYSAVIVLPHSSDITISMDTIDACWQFNVVMIFGGINLFLLI